ncbi:hypothetical protein HPB52_011409 [Rhipicephalus sanguineus]|uniref:Uncharacterized protein n=1 Tax=Rhipicephalus sanguineus TaxID=34632 RepID=A0A9D4SQ39_RHISA|nr:hypothetical protein HPB52_011409 [Rhipicephalus sanguineus]
MHLRASCHAHAAPRVTECEKLSDAVEKGIATVVRTAVQEQAGEMKALLERVVRDNSAFNDSLIETPPGSRNTSPVPVNTPVHRASRRQRGLPPEAPEQPTDTVTMTSPQAAMERSAVFDRQVNTASSPEFSATLGSNSIEWIREIVRSVVREEIQKLYGPRQPEVGSIASVIRDEVQQVLHNRHYQTMPTNVEPAPVSTDIRSPPQSRSR